MGDSQKIALATNLSILTTTLLVIHVLKRISVLERKLTELKSVQVYEDSRALASEIERRTPVGDTISPCDDQCYEDDESDDYVHLKLLVTSCLDHVPARDMSDDRVIYVKDSTSAADVIDDLHNTLSTLGIVMTDRGYFIGVLEASDVLRHLLQPDCKKNARYMLQKSILADATTRFNTFLYTLSDGNRHVAVVNDGHAFVVSQRSFVQYLRLHEKKCPANIRYVLDAKVKDMLQAQSVICCSCNQSARYAFEVMSAYGFTSLPITNNDGTCCGVISSTDIYLARKGDMLLNLHVMDFLKKSRCDSGSKRELNSVVYCSREDSVLSCIERMNKESVHHLYILDSERVPKGVVSYVDILHTIRKNAF
jgi:predicted transcriptional regulator